MKNILNDITEIYKYKTMLYYLVKRNLRSRYKGSFLGFLWTLLTPLLQLVIYGFVFSVLFPNEIDNFSFFLLCGLLPWNYFISSITTSVDSIVGNSNLVKKIYFPRLVLPLSNVITYFIDFLMGFAILLIVFILMGNQIGITLIYFPLILIIQTILQCGLAFILCSLYVSMRDISYIVNIVTMMGFYLTPIVYSAVSFSSDIQLLLSLNPLTEIIEAYRAILLYGEMPNINIMYSLFVSIILLILGLYVFHKLNKTFAEEL
ncbi:ABC transporter permease [Anaerorhabdus furcosa]|uniref:Transport permease protein n=1 Tax=Anaerorhabdus furcosa TaxID=118967 RepID=A0A1T4NZF8_9FIRM|nr:ABC transporter permease [Anaerorhabdus furcosa]SJZ84426.1 ABC-2 type transport system permease protein [Anaerorhabdus furcosa]